MDTTSIIVITVILCILVLLKIFWIKAAFFFSPLTTIEKVVKRWNPEKYKNEEGYTKSLYQYLSRKLKSLDVVKGFGIARTKADVAVRGTGKKVCIELKKDFNRTDKLQRLLGQLQIYQREGWKRILIILCGNTDTNTFQDLRKLVSSFRKSDVHMSIIRK